MQLKKILITGASRGVGKAIKDLLQNNYPGYSVNSPDRKELDLDDLDNVNTFISRKLEYDILINVAGINLLRDIDSCSIDVIEQMLNVNLKSPLLLIKGVSPYMKKQKYGKILNFSSIWGIRSKEFRTLYSISKFGLNGMTKSLAHELGPYNILVNSICPGYINTEMTMQNVTEQVQQEIKQTLPLKRFAEPNEIAEFAEFLISDRNSYITGQNLVIDGGFTA